MSRNKLPSLTALQALPGLLSIDASRNDLGQVDLTALPALQKANLARNRLTTVAGTTLGGSLTWLDLSRNALCDVSAANAVAPLRWLGLAHNQLTHVVLTLPALTTLTLSHNPLASLDGLAGLPALQQLTASECGVRRAWLGGR